MAFIDTPECSEVIEKVVFMRRLKNGRADASYDEIARRLNAEGIPTAQGKKWLLKLTEYYFKRYGGRLLNEQARGQAA